ncbi:prolactin-releasing peptide receptor-like [Ylistrum balloti]|uniref:prolactin-releasing peptide receptor-like n=1 Tax=Ylistrum balloti TaxID=509963 RepID=UPI002905EBF3|nr:prolactin-releasing peptide receptor-like [Ylistrum balloti]
MFSSDHLWCGPTNHTLITNASYDWSLLSKLNEDKATLYMPVIISVAVLMVIGTIGNILVIYIYNWRLKRRSANLFIGTMAIFDLLSCVIAMPVEILDLSNPYMFYSGAICKLFRFAESITVYGSAMILVLIAFDRYFKICKPLRILPLSRIKLMCGLAGFLAILFSVPAFILFGITCSDTSVIGLRGYDCSISEDYKGGPFQQVYFTTLIIMFIAAFSCMIGFYIRLWIEIKHRRDTVISDHVTSPKSPAVVRKFKVSRNSTSDDESASNSQVTAEMSKKSKRLASIAETSPQIKLSRTTLIFFSVSIVFIVSYLPGIVINIFRAVKPDYHSSMTPGEEVMMKFLTRTYLISNSANPFVYSFLNTNFRSQCRKLFSSVVYCCKQTMERETSPGLRKKSKESQQSGTER